MFRTVFTQPVITGFNRHGLASRKAAKSLDNTGISSIIKAFSFGPSGEIRTHGLMVPNHSAMCRSSGTRAT